MALTPFGPYPRTRVPGSTHPSWLPGERAARERELQHLDELRRRKHPKRTMRRVRPDAGSGPVALNSSLAEAYHESLVGRRESTRSTLHGGQWC